MASPWHLPLKHRKDLEFVDESIVVEIDLNRKKVLFLLLYSSSSQSPTEFASFMEKLSMFYNKAAPENHTSIVLTGDFNARSPILWRNETKLAPEGKALGDFAVLNGFEQIIDEPTHLPREDIGICIDLISTNQRYLFVDSGVIPSPDPACKHQIVFGKLNFSVPCPLHIKGNYGTITLLTYVI